MKKQLLTLALILVSLSGIESYSQIVFESGYFIDESNQKIECLIKNIDWYSNPTEFEYKLSQDSEVQTATIQNVKEFGVDNFFRYIRTKVEIDRSSSKIGSFSFERDPVFQEEVLFLKVLLEGPASLFLYKDGELTRFFYSLDDSEITQLVFKNYATDDDGMTFAENNYYKQQLFLKLKCNDLREKDFELLEYEKRYLERLFVKYNECVDPNYISNQPKQKKDIINLSLRPGLSYNNLMISNTMYSHLNSEFNNLIGISFGIEAEFVMPFNKNKWGLIIEPNYQFIKAELTQHSNFTRTDFISKIDFKIFQLPVGIRHYFYLNEKSKLFANISCVFNLSEANSSVSFFEIDGTPIQKSLNIKSASRYSFGLGYKYKDRYSIEMQYKANDDILSDYVYWRSSDFNSFSIIFGYSLFK